MGGNRKHGFNQEVAATFSDDKSFTQNKKSKKKKEGSVKNLQNSPRPLGIGDGAEVPFC